MWPAQPAFETPAASPPYSSAANAPVARHAAGAAGAALLGASAAQQPASPAAAAGGQEALQGELAGKGVRRQAPSRGGIMADIRTRVPAGHQGAHWALL
jgi:hypothetical protein